MIDFPVFLMWKDSGYFYLFEDLADLNRVEENDIYSEEFVLWDANGRLLDYGEDEQNRIWLKESAAAGPDLATKLTDQLASRKLDLRVRQNGEFTEAVKVLMESQQQEDRGLVAGSRRLINWVRERMGK